MKPLVIGLVGGIGSGKSAVAAAFARRGARVIAADELGHEALRQPAIRDQIRERLGAEPFDAWGEIDRRKLARVVFGDEGQRRWLEALTHPYIRRRAEEEIARARAEGAPLIVLDAAVLLEAGWHEVCDELVYVDAAAEQRRARVALTRGWAAQDWEDRERAQLPLTQKHTRADHVVDNSSTLERLEQQVDDLMHRLVPGWPGDQTAESPVCRPDPSPP